MNLMLEIKGLDVFYGDVQAVTDVSLHVDEGEIFALVGANGAGKSTLLKTISGTTHAEKGDIIFSGKKITNLPPQDIVDIGISKEFYHIVVGSLCCEGAKYIKGRTC